MQIVADARPPELPRGVAPRGAVGVGWARAIDWRTLRDRPAWTRRCRRRPAPSITGR